MKIMQRKPTHPGQILKEDYIEPLGITTTALSKILGIGVGTLSKITNESASITPEIALKLSMAFDTSAEFWLNLQGNYDLWQAANMSTEWQEIKPIVEPFVAQAA